MNNITFGEYQAMALRTLAPGSARDHLLHGALGLSTELGELFEAGVNRIEECGDMLWYVAVIAHAACVPTDLIELEHKKTPTDISEYELIACVARINDLIKRHAFYGAELDDLAFGAALGRLVFAIKWFLGFGGGSLSDAYRANIDKLRVRYPDGFSEHDAIHRDLDAEVVAMTGGSVTRSD